MSAVTRAQRYVGEGYIDLKEIFDRTVLVCSGFVSSTRATASDQEGHALASLTWPEKGIKALLSDRKF